MADVITRFKVETAEYDRKIGQSKKKLDELGKAGKGAGDMIKEFTSKMGMSVGSLTAMTGAAGAGALAMNTLKDAFFKNEQMLDEWGRTVESSKSLYSGFLNAINNGNISGYLTNINSIVTAARNAYDALDNLATFNAFNQINVEKGQTGFTEAMASFREGTGSKESVQAAGEEVKKQLRARAEFEKKAYQDEVNRIAAERGISGSILMDALSGSYEDYDRLKSLPMTGKKSEWKTNQYGMAYEVKSTVAANKEEELGNALRQLNDTELQNLQALGAQAQRTATEIAQVDKQMSRVLKETTTPKGGGGGGGRTTNPENQAIDGTIRYYQEMISGLNKQVGDAVDADVRDKLNNTIRIAKEELSRLQTGGNTWSLSSGASVSAPTGGSQLKDAAASFKPDAIDRVNKAWEDYQTNVKAAHAANQQAIGSLAGIGQALQSIQNPAAKVMGIVAEAIASVALAAGQAMSAKDTTSSGWAWIGAAAAITATMVTSIAAIKSATSGSYAYGGEIKGNSYSGDNLLMPMVGGGAVAVNAGEYVFNRAQMGNLAAQLRGGAEQRAQEIRVRIENDQLVGTLRNANTRAAYHA